MIKERLRLFRNLFRCVDGTAVTASFVVAYYLRTFLPFEFLSEPRGPESYLPLLAVVVPLWVLLLHWFGGNRSFRTVRVRDLIWRLVKAEGIGLLCLSWFLFFFRFHYVSRTFLIGFGVLSFLALAAVRVGMVLFFQAARRHGYNYRNVLVVGTSPRAREFAYTLESHREWGFRIVGFVDADPSLVGRRVDGHRVIGTFDDLARLTSERVIDEVVFVVPRSWLARLDGALRLLDELGIKATVALDLFDLPVSRPRLGEVNGVPMLTYAPTPTHEGQYFVKRVLDRVIAAALLLALAPLFILIALAIKLTSPGPVFFRQERVGLHGRRFTLLKFRSMVEDAERRRPELMARNEMSGPVFKMADDPRVTRLGHWLRKLSLDELPQLINVMRGEMSFVGPRPPLPDEVGQYQQWQRRRLSMPPGLTGLWQIGGRNRVDFETWMRLDLAYIDNWSLGLDLKILAKTVPAVLSGAGAS